MTRSSIRWLLGVIVVGHIAFALASAQSPRPMGVVDLLSVPRLSEPELSPDGREAVFVRSDADWKSGNLAIRDLKTGATRLLTQDRDGPCPQDLIFSPDGKQIAYRCDGMRTAQPLRIVQLESARLREISVREDGLFIFKSSWSPDGKLIAATKYSEAEKAHGVALIAVSNG